MTKSKDIMPAAIRLIVFDWDGTLMDSETQIVHSMFGAIRDMQLESRTADQCRNIIGLGLKEAIDTLYPGRDEPLTGNSSTSAPLVFDWPKIRNYFRVRAKPCTAKGSRLLTGYRNRQRGAQAWKKRCNKRNWNRCFQLRAVRMKPVPNRTRRCWRKYLQETGVSSRTYADGW